MKLSLIIIWICVLTSVLFCLVTVGFNLVDRFLVASAIDEFNTVSLEISAQQLLERASSLQSRVKEIESKRLALRQSKRDADSAKDVMQMDEAKSLASYVQGEIAKVRKMIGEFNDAHKKN